MSGISILSVILITRVSVFKCTLLYLLENLSCSGVKYKCLSSVHHIWWQQWDPLPASQGQGPLADAATAGRHKIVVLINAITCSAREGLL